MRRMPVDAVLCFALALCLQPYDKFAGLYGAKTYWGYDGADTGEDPFEARMWDTRHQAPPHARKPKQWDGFEDFGGFDDGASETQTHYISYTHALLALLLMMHL
jgi:hypothetical protein